jgi:hypothetical protein
VAERDAAIHAPRRLLAQVVLVQRQRELAEVPDAVAGELIFRLDAVVFEEACDLAHQLDPSGCKEAGQSFGASCSRASKTSIPTIFPAASKSTMRPGRTSSDSTIGSSANRTKKASVSPS